MAEKVLQTVLRDLPFHIELKGQQKEALTAFIEKKDIFFSAPTGFGKSIVYQLTPFVAAVRDKVPVQKCGYVTIVITPLTSLMKDQVASMTKKGISSCYYDMKLTSAETCLPQFTDETEIEDSSGHTFIDSNVTIEESISGKYQLIYAHPEAFLSTKTGQKLLKSSEFISKVCCLAIDEAHIIQEWGDDFRKDFGRLKSILASLPNIPILLLTATASQYVMNMLLTQLEIKDPFIIKVNPDRPNIMYLKHKRKVSTNTKDDLDLIVGDFCKELMEKRRQFPITIVYTDLDSITYCYELLNDMMKEKQYEGEAMPENRLFGQFHAFYPEKMKSNILKNLSEPNSCIRLLFATVALGMGINAPCIRRIIHFKPPTSLERYLQESGRAGRDGHAAKAILYYNNQDIRPNRPGIQKEMIDYCRNESTCLRSSLLQHFGYQPPDSRDRMTCCSVCATK